MESVVSFVKRVRGLGADVELDGHGIKVLRPGKLAEADRIFARSHKAELIGYLRALNGEPTAGELATVPGAEAGASAEDPKSSAGPVVKCLADIEPREIAWLWPGRIALGRISLLVGRPGLGKSFLTCDMASRVSRGDSWPDGGECPQGSVLLISAEDDPHDTIRPRLDAHGADCSRVHLLAAVRRLDDDGTPMERMVTLADLRDIERSLADLKDCKLLIVDPVGSFLGGRVDAHRDSEVRGVLAPLGQLAEKYGCAVLVVAHQRKSPGGSADSTTLGSVAFVGIARTVLHLGRDPEDKGRKLLLPGKNNLSAEMTGLAFRIDGLHPRITWEDAPLEMDADDGLAAELRGQKPGPASEECDRAKTWLRCALTNGPRPAKDLIDEWVSGEAGAKRTLDRAKQLMEVQGYRPLNPGPWWWRLPSKNGQEHIAKVVEHTAKQLELGDLGNVPI